MMPYHYIQGHVEGLRLCPTSLGYFQFLSHLTTFTARGKTRWLLARLENSEDGTLPLAPTHPGMGFVGYVCPDRLLQESADPVSGSRIVVLSSRQSVPCPSLWQGKI